MLCRNNNVSLGITPRYPPIPNLLFIGIQKIQVVSHSLRTLWYRDFCVI